MNYRDAVNLWPRGAGGLMARTRSSRSLAAKADYRILLDAPAEKPELGYPKIASALADIVMESEPRFAIGIFGGWGSGKTTLMQAVESNLPPDRAVPVRFSAWRYEKEEHLILPLLDTIRDALVHWGENRQGHIKASRDTARTIGRVMKAIVAGTSVSIGVPGAINASFDANKALEAGGRMSAAQAEARVPRSAYHASFKALQEAFEDFAGPKGKERRIVVFIDDLDRCLPGSALQVLESMKLFFDLEGFVFVVGLDRAVVEEVVASKFRSANNGTSAGENGGESAIREARVLGENYIEKIFQVPYTLAPLAVGQLPAFLGAVYAEAELPKTQRDDFRNVVEPHLPSVIRDGSVNPREVKRYLNAYTIATKINDDLDPSVVLAILTINFRNDWEDVESALLLNGDIFVDALRRLHAGEATALEDVGIDLRLPDDFVTYTRGGQPGQRLVEARDIERYLQNVGTARLSRDPDILLLLPSMGAIRRGLSVVRDDPDQSAEVFGNAHKSMSMVRSRLQTLSSTSALAGLILEDVEMFTQKAKVAEHPTSGDRLKLLDELDELVRRVSERLLVLYRSPRSVGSRR